MGLAPDRPSSGGAHCILPPARTGRSSVITAKPAHLSAWPKAWPKAWLGEPAWRSGRLLADTSPRTKPDLPPSFDVMHHLQLHANLIVHDSSASKHMHPYTFNDTSGTPTRIATCHLRPTLTSPHHMHCLMYILSFFHPSLLFLCSFFVLIVHCIHVVPEFRLYMFINSS